MESVKSHINIPAQFGNRFCKRAIDLLYLAAYKAIDFHKLTANTHRREEYAYDYTQVIKKLNKKWKEKGLA